MKYKVKNKVPQGGEVNKDFEGSGFLATGFRRQKAILRQWDFILSGTISF